MNLIKNLVSKNKNRIETDKHSLDLSYITSRVLAMSFPSDSIVESIIHNNINEISQYLNSRYTKNNYYIYNLSGIDYDRSKFNNNVSLFQWADHEAPPLFDILTVCELSVSFLCQRDINIVVFHCLAGKGRTGTVICCLLLFCGATTVVKEAVDYFAIKRFGAVGRGVTQPSQLRYISFFNYMMNNPLYFNPILITKITIEGVALYNGRVTIKSGNNHGSEIQYISHENKKHLVYNDVVIYIYRTEVGFFGKDKGIKLTAWLCFHTSLLHTMSMNIKTGENKGKLMFFLKDIDPFSLAKNEKYQNIKIVIEYENYIFNINKDSEELRALFEKEHQKVVEVNNRVLAVNRWKKIENYNGEAKCIFGGSKNDIKKTICLQ